MMKSKMEFYSEDIQWGFEPWNEETLEVYGDHATYTEEDDLTEVMRVIYQQYDMTRTHLAMEQKKEIQLAGFYGNKDEKYIGWYAYFTIEVNCDGSE